MQGLLAAFMNPPADEVGFNAWYDEEHVPNRTALDGFLSARRFSAAEAGDGPRYLALYELASPDVLQGEAYRKVATERSPREREVMAQIPMMDRRVYELVLDGDAWTDEPAYVLTVAMTPPAGNEDDFVAWYRQEHIRLLLEVPGWRRVRLYRLLEGTAPAFMAVHELETADVFQRPEYEAAIATEWRNRIRNSVLQYERNLFRLLRNFPVSR